MDADQARSRLERMLAELDGSVATLEREDAWDDSSELSRIDQHPADSASIISEGDREDAVLQSARGQRDQVVAALARIDSGSYGTCTDCGQELSKERLDARPEAARCVDCQALAEQRGDPS